jgi:hypothetical protein
MTTLPPLTQQLSLPLISGALDGPAKTSAMPTLSVEDLLVLEVDFSTHLWHLLWKSAQNGLSWKMSRAYSRQSTEPLLRQLSTNWKRVGIWGDGLRATFPMRAYLTTEIEYSLSQLIDQTVPINSLLTAANCMGILRREAKAGRQLDPLFQQALEENIRLWSNVAEASGIPQQQAFAPRYVPKLEAIKAVIQTDQYCVARNLTWNECERLMGFPPGWTVVEGDSLATQSLPSSLNGSGEEF